MTVGLEIYDEQGRLQQSSDFYVGTLLDRRIYNINLSNGNEGFIYPILDGLHFLQGDFYTGPSACAGSNNIFDDEGIRITRINGWGMPPSVRVWSYGLPPLEDDGQGLVVYNEAGEVTFNSQNPYMQIVGAYFMKVDSHFGGNITQIQTPFTGSNYAVCLAGANIYSTTSYIGSVGIYIERDWQMSIWLDSGGTLHADSVLIFETEGDTGTGTSPHDGSSGTVIIVDISNYPV